MVGPGAGGAATCRDALVQQLLQDRRRKLQEKLNQVSSTAPHALAGEPLCDAPDVVTPPPFVWHSWDGVLAADEFPAGAAATLSGSWRSPFGPLGTPPWPGDESDGGSSGWPVLEGSADGARGGNPRLVPPRPASARSSRPPLAPQLPTPRAGASPRAAGLGSTTGASGSRASSGSRSARLGAGDSGRVAARPLSAPPTRSPGGDFRGRVREWGAKHSAFKLRQQAAQMEQEARALEECTFRPAINAKSDFYARRARSCMVEPLAHRLHHEADRRANLRSKAKELVEVDEVCGCSFHPRINPPGPEGSADRAPIHMRVGDIQRMRQERRREAQDAEAARGACFFQPRISDRSHQLVQRKRDKLYRSLSQGNQDCVKLCGPVEDRLYAEAQRPRREEGSVGEPAPATPSLDDGSRRICESSVYFQGAQRDFLTRQQTFELARQRRLQVLEQHAEATCTFRPSVSDRSHQVVCENQSFVGETQGERLHRLAVKDVERREQTRQALEHLHSRACTFHPEVSPASRALAARAGARAGGSRADGASESGEEAPGGGSVHERLYRSAASRPGRSAESQSLQTEEDECSFQPQLSRSSQRFTHVKSHYAGDPSEIMGAINRQHDRRAEYQARRRQEVEQERRSECTFAPTTGKRYKEPKQAVVVSGLGRFFELRGLAQQRQREQHDREARVFRPEAARPFNAGVTIPEPFDLSARPRRDAAAAGQAGQAALGACTFTPLTSETANREIIQQLMSCALSDHTVSAKDSGAHARLSLGGVA